MVNLPSFNASGGVDRIEQARPRGCPDDVRSTLGRALFAVQCGVTPRIAKPLSAFGAGVSELRTWDAAGTFRLVYAVRLKKAVYILHVFQKKSKHGIAIPREEVTLIETRLREARRMDGLAGR